jgi:ribosome-binding factor A
MRVEREKPMRDDGPRSRSGKPEPVRESTAPGGGRGARGARSRGSSGRAAGPLGPVAPASDRPAQVAGEIRRALQAELARGLNDPRVQGLISITEVVLSPDLADARVHVSVLPEDRAALTLSGLRAAAGFLRRRVMEGTRIGRVPRIGFELDVRLKRQAALDSILRSEGNPTPAEPAADSPAENTTR